MLVPTGLYRTMKESAVVVYHLTVARCVVILSLLRCCGVDPQNNGVPNVLKLEVVLIYDPDAHKFSNVQL